MIIRVCDSVINARGGISCTKRARAYSQNGWVEAINKSIYDIKNYSWADGKVDLRNDIMRTEMQLISFIYIYIYIYIFTHTHFRKLRYKLERNYY